MKKVILFLLLAMIPFAAPVNLDACGPFFPVAIFAYSMHPDFPLASFAAGNLGILQPTYARSYLYVAYRHMAGTGFDEVEQSDLTRLWEERLNLMPVDSTEPVQEWLDARSAVPGIPEPESIDSYKLMDYVSFPNCTIDAFASAAATLKDRIQKFGAANPDVREWILAQDQVFANCAGEEPSIPEAAAATVPAVLRADRQYQIAAAYFYSGNYPEARKRFQEISADAASPWKGIAPYLAVRTLVREGTVGAGIEEPPNTEVLRQAEQLLQKMPDDPAAQRLLAYVRVRIDPAARAHELVPALLKSESETLYQDLWDYTVSLDKLSANAPQPDELTEWLFTFQSDSPESFDASLSKWKKGAALPWLVSAISKAPASSPAAADLIAAAEKIPGESPAYFTLAYHTVRLFMGSGNNDAARRKLDALLSHSKADLPATARNRFLAQRMALALNLDELLQYAQRTPATVGIDWGLEMTEEAQNYPVPPAAILVDNDGAAVLNTLLPLDILEKAARSNVLDAALRKRLMKAVWVRAVMLNRMDVAVRMVADMQPLLPDAAPLWKAVLSESDPQAARFAAVFLMLNNPGLEPIMRSGLERETPAGEMDIYRDNWWCAIEWTPDVQAPFLDAAARDTATAESASIKDAGPGPNFLAAQVIQWAGAHLDDPRVPEALHLSVRATRYGCTDNATTRYSKEAFQLLHKNFPRSEWAKKTPYYY